MSARHLSTAERQRLVALLGMLGSDQPGERDNAARLAEKFRRQYGMTWADLLNLDALPPEPPKPEPPPQPKPKAEAPKPPPPPNPAATSAPWPHVFAHLREDHKRFHSVGSAAYPNWDKRCISLEKAGVGKDFQQELVDHADGVMLTFALSCDLQTARAIANLPKLARSIALAKFADTLKAKASPPPPPPKPAARPTASTVRPLTEWEEASFGEKAMLVLAAAFLVMVIILPFADEYHLINLNSLLSPSPQIVHAAPAAASLRLSRPPAAPPLPWGISPVAR
jgi:hypothetical protein